MKDFLEKETKDIKRKFFQKKLYAGIFILMGIAMITMAIKLEGWLVKIPIVLIGIIYIIYGGNDLYVIIRDEKEFNEEQKKYEEGVIQAEILEKMNTKEEATDTPEEKKSELKIIKKRPTKKKKEKTQTV